MALLKMGASSKSQLEKTVACSGGCAKEILGKHRNFGRLRRRWQ